MAMQWLERSNTRGASAESRSKYVSVSWTRTGRKDAESHVLVISLSVNAMKDMRLQIGDRLQLGHDDSDGGWLVIRRNQNAGSTITPAGAKGKGGSEKLRGHVQAGTAKFSNAPFGLPPFAYTPLTKQDVISDGDMLRIPVSDLKLVSQDDLFHDGQKHERRVLPAKH
jgi:hypothetical protein